MATPYPKSPRHWSKIGAYSRRLDRGVLGIAIDGRSETGRFARALEGEFMRFLGHEPNIVDRLRIDMLVKLRVRLDLLTQKLDSGKWTAHDQRTYGGLHSAFRLLLRELKPGPAAPVETLESYLARRAEPPAPASEPEAPPAEAPPVRYKRPRG